MAQRWVNENPLKSAATHTHKTNTFMLNLDLPLAERLLPELSGIALGDPELVPCEGALRKRRLQLRKHVREDERQFGELPSLKRRLIEHLFFAFLEETQRLLALPHHVQNEHLQRTRNCFRVSKVNQSTNQPTNLPTTMLTKRA